MLDTGLIMFACLFFLFLWRLFFPYTFFTERIREANYTIVLYAVLTFIILYDIILFAWTALQKQGKASWDTLPGWLQPLVIFGPIAAVLSLAMSFMQSGSHLLKVRQGEAAQHHDQVIQILALPAVYGVMSMSALTRLYQLHTKTYLDDSAVAALTETQQEALAISKSETCFLVADMFESWALYQFGKMTLQVVESSIKRQTGLADLEKSKKAEGMMKSHSAVDSLTWAGIIMFLLNCFAEACWSLYLLTFSPESVKTTEDYYASLSVFTGAGFVASTAAIWNVAVVEYVFHDDLHGYSPFSKFLSVKILVSFAYCQECFFGVLIVFEKTLPSVAQDIVRKVPFLGDILHMNEAEFQLFYAALLLYECLFVVILHWMAWDSGEEWYQESATMIDECTPLTASKEAD